MYYTTAIMECTKAWALLERMHSDRISEGIVLDDTDSIFMMLSLAKGVR